MDLVSLASLSEADVRAIWAFASAPHTPMQGHVAWSFEGNGIRTRTTFIRAFRELGLEFTELPNLLKTSERVEDLAGYLDGHFDGYVIRESDHDRLARFALASSRPVINAMSSLGHPCEVLADAHYLEQRFNGLSRLAICLWGPPTNVFRSWHELAQILTLDITHVCDPSFHREGGPVSFTQHRPARVDVVITDSWPPGTESLAEPLTNDHLNAMGKPVWLPTPPFTIGREAGMDPVTYPGFVGYSQKNHLLPVQKAILRYAMDRNPSRTVG